MKIWHRGHIAVQHKMFLEESGIEHKPWFSALNPKKVTSYMFIISEDHPFWPEVKERIGGGDKYYISTEFTKKEISEAEWVLAHAMHSVKSVRPGDDGWSTEFFADQCKNCGAGWRQIAPFRIKREPKLGKSVFADFGSAFELFCTPLVLETFAKNGITGYETRDLILDKDNRPAESLKQLVATETAEPAIAEELVEHERYSQTDCPVCGRTWHAHYTRGALPLRKASLKSNADLQLTWEWFGNGRTARQEILISKRVVQLILGNRWRGIRLTPIKAV